MIENAKLEEYSTLADDLGQCADAKIAIAYWGSRHASQAIEDLVAEVRRLRSELQEHKDVTRVELIVNSQRDRVIYGASEVATALQDDGRTLKVFMKHDGVGWNGTTRT